MAPVGESDGFPALSRLTGGESGFLDEVWGKGSHLAVGAFGPGSGGPPLSLDDFVELAAERGLRAPVARIVRDGRNVEADVFSFADTEASVPVDGLLRPEFVSEAVASGHTVVLRNLQHFHPPLRRFCRQLELEMHHPVQANAYLTPAGGGGLLVHHDHHDVFVIQVHGTKGWELYQPAMEYPVEPWDYDRDRPGPSTGSVVTGAGDCLYMARGIPHSARAGDRPSLHVTLGVRARTWLDAVRALVDRSATLVEFRQSLPPGFGDDPERLRTELIERLRLLPGLAGDEGVGDELAGSFWWHRRPPYDGHLRDILDLDSLSPDTVVQWRSDHACRVVRRPKEVVVRLWDRDLVFEDRFAPAVETLMEGGPMPVAGLDSFLPVEDRLEVVSRLVEAGVVRVRPPA